MGRVFVQYPQSTDDLGLACGAVDRFFLLCSHFLGMYQDVVHSMSRAVLALAQHYRVGWGCLCLLIFLASSHRRRETRCRTGELPAISQHSSSSPFPAPSSPPSTSCLLHSRAMGSVLPALAARHSLHSAEAYANDLHILYVVLLGARSELEVHADHAPRKCSWTLAVRIHSRVRSHSASGHIHLARHIRSSGAAPVEGNWLLVRMGLLVFEVEDVRSASEALEDRHCMDLSQAEAALWAQCSVWYAEKAGVLFVASADTSDHSCALGPAAIAGQCPAVTCRIRHYCTCALAVRSHPDHTRIRNLDHILLPQNTVVGRAESTLGRIGRTHGLDTPDWKLADAAPDILDEAARRPSSDRRPLLSVPKRRLARGIQ